VPFLAALVWSALSVTLQAQSTSGGTFQVGRASNLNVKTSYINLSNTTSNPICANIFEFDPDEELAAQTCCTVPAGGSAYVTVGASATPVDFALVADSCMTGGGLVTGLNASTSTWNLNTNTGTYFGTISPFQNAVLAGGGGGGGGPCGGDPVELQCNAGLAPLGTINVTTNLAAATFTITGPATYTGSGTSFTQTFAPAGTYSIVFGAVAGYQTPPPESLTLPNGGVITFVGIYIPLGSQQVRYFSNLNVGDSSINISNTDSSDSPNNLCVSVYAFDPSEEMVACCACLITPNALVSLSAQADLIGNTLSSSSPTSLVVELMATPATGPSCNPSTPTISNLAPGLAAWGTTLHALPGTPSTYGITEGAFLPSLVNAAEIQHLSSFCGFIQSNGSGFGVCKSCRAGGLGGAKQ
jgi:hypothetical protein